MAPKEPPFLGLHVLLMNLALSMLFVGLFPLASCAHPQPDAEATEDDQDGADDEGGQTDGDDAGDEQSTDEMSVDDFVHQAAEHNCSAFARCMGPALNAVLSGQSCSERRGFVLEDSLAGLAPLIDEGRVRYDADKARACLAGLEEVSCDDLRSADELDCPGALTGTVELGEACDRDVECADDAYCALTEACPGVCTARHGQGEACVAERECELSLACVAGRCLASAAAQQPCNADVPCGLSAFCVGARPAREIDGTCVPIPDTFAAEEGAECKFSDARYCAPGLSCVVAVVGHGGGVIAYCEKPSAAGASCSLGFPTPCSDGQYCDADPNVNGYNGTCRPLPLEGEACVRISGAPPCAVGLGCVPEQEICKPIGRIGDACQGDGECHSGHCASGECKSGLGC